MAHSYVFDWLPISTFQLYPMLAIVLVGYICGSMGSLVVGNRMAFMSDAMAHTAFAGVALALLGIIVFAEIRTASESDPYLWLIPIVTSLIGATIGICIVYVREQSGLTHDTVIGVFFALAMGIGAMLLPEVRSRIQIDPDQFLYGSVTLARPRDLSILLLLAVCLSVVLGIKYNQLAFASLSPGLAASRGIPVRMNNYLFVVVLALAMNLSLKIVGVLLINSLLIVPAAAAANIGSNLRQVYWITIFGTIGCGIVGWELSQLLVIPLGGSRTMEPGPSGTIVVCCVVWFLVTLLYRGIRRNKRSHSLLN